MYLEVKLRVPVARRQKYNNVTKQKAYGGGMKPKGSILSLQ